MLVYSFQRSDDRSWLFKRYTNKHSARCSALIVFVSKYYSNDHVKFGLW